MPLPTVARRRPISVRQETFVAPSFSPSRASAFAITNSPSLRQIKWSSQDSSVLQGYRRAYRLDCPSSFKNPLSHVVLNQGIGRMSPTMSRPKGKRRVHKDQLGMAVKKSFNSQAVTESDVIVDWLYKSKHQGMDRD
jgi:histone deacetylase complex subunit SAP30